MTHLHYCVPGKHWYKRPACATVTKEHDCPDKIQIVCEEHKEER